MAAPAPFAECDVVIVRRHRRWAWGSREGKQEEEGEAVEVEAQAEPAAAAAGRLGGAARGPEPLELRIATAAPEDSRSGGAAAATGEMSREA